MKLNKKGFTLVELLAVIVVLAIIALIGYSVVGDVISTSQTKGDKISIENFATSLSNAILLNGVDTTKGIAVTTVKGASTSEPLKSDVKGVDGKAIYQGSLISCTGATADTDGTVTLSGCQFLTADGKVDTGRGTWAYEAGSAKKS